MPRSRTYELRGQGKKEMYKIKTNTHLTLSYKNYLQNHHTPLRRDCICVREETKIYPYHLIPERDS